MSNDEDHQQDFEEIRQGNPVRGALVNLPVSMVSHKEKQTHLVHSAS